MTPEDVLAIPPNVLTDKQRQSYFENGYLLLESVISDSWIEPLRAATSEMIDESRSITESDQKWDLEEGHSEDDPRLRRLSSPNDHHITFWEYASQSIVPEIVMSSPTAPPEVMVVVMEVFV